MAGIRFRQARKRNFCFYSPRRIWRKWDKGRTSARLKSKFFETLTERCATLSKSAPPPRSGQFICVEPHISCVRGFGRNQQLRQARFLAQFGKDMPGDLIAAGVIPGASVVQAIDSILSLPAKRYFIRQYLEPLALISRYIPPPSASLEGFSFGFAVFALASVSAMTFSCF